jgi:tetratricopeptide (TPR) repeat protein
MGLLEQGDVDLAISELEKGVFDDPDSFEVRKTLASAYLKKGNLEMAVGHLRSATEQVDDFDTWQQLSQVYFDLKDFDSAEKSIAHTAKLDKSSAEPWKLLARVYMSKQMWKESIDASEEAIARGSDTSTTYNGLGFAYLMIGRYDDSVRELEKAVSFDDGVTPQIWNNLGVAYEKSGQLADAAQAYRASLAGNPTYVKAKVNLDRVTEIAKKESVPVGEEKAQLDKTDLEGKTVPATGEAGGQTVDPGTKTEDVPVQP